MRKFFLKALAFIVGISLIFNVTGTLADRVAPLEDWRVDHQHSIADLEARSEVIEAVTLGNSHSDAIDYSVLGIEGQSLAFAAADLFEVEKYAAYLEDRLPNLKTVFITISYYSFSRDNATFEPFRSRRVGFYSMVPVWSPIQGDLANFWLGRLESYTHVPTTSYAQISLTEMGQYTREGVIHTRDRPILRTIVPNQDLEWAILTTQQRRQALQCFILLVVRQDSDDNSNGRRRSHEIVIRYCLLSLPAVSR